MREHDSGVAGGRGCAEGCAGHDGGPGFAIFSWLMQTKLLQLKLFFSP